MRAKEDRKRVARQGPVKVNWDGSTQITDLAEYFEDIDLKSLQQSMEELKKKMVPSR